MDLLPKWRLNRTVQLCASVGANRNDERTMQELFSKAHQSGIIERLDAVGSEAPRRPAKYMYEHCHIGGIGAKVRMQMLNARFSQPGFNPASLREVSQVYM